MDDWERNFAELSARRHHRRHKRRLQRQAKTIAIIGIIVAAAIWFLSGAADRTFDGAGQVLHSQGHR